MFGRRRYDISNSMVQAMLDKGLSVCEAARRLGCSQMIVTRVKYCTRKDPVIPERFTKAFKQGKRRCTCCQIKPVKKGNYFLCEDCYKNADGEGPELAVCIARTRF